MSAEQNQTPVGLCEQCSHAARVTGARGGTFYLCKQSTIDARYPRYPRLPVHQCEAYEPLSSEPLAGEPGALP